MRVLVKRATSIGMTKLTKEEFLTLVVTFGATVELGAVEYVPCDIALAQMCTDAEAEMSDSDLVLLVTRRGEYGVLSPDSVIWDRKIKA